MSHVLVCLTQLHTVGRASWGNGPKLELLAGWASGYVLHLTQEPRVCPSMLVAL